MPRLLFTPGKDPVPIIQEAEWVPGPVWTGAENLAPTGIRSTDRPVPSQSLYRLRYPTHQNNAENTMLHDVHKKLRKIQAEDLHNVYYTSKSEDAHKKKRQIRYKNWKQNLNRETLGEQTTRKNVHALRKEESRII
jgi:hypothetical protein